MADPHHTDSYEAACAAASPSAAYEVASAAAACVVASAACAAYAASAASAAYLDPGAQRASTLQKISTVLKNTRHENTIKQKQIKKFKNIKK